MIHAHQSATQRGQRQDQRREIRLLGDSVSPGGDQPGAGGGEEDLVVPRRRLCGLERAVRSAFLFVEQPQALEFLLRGGEGGLGGFSLPDQRCQWRGVEHPAIAFQLRLDRGWFGGFNAESNSLLGFSIERDDRFAVGSDTDS